MTIKIDISGFGRIGRMVFRATAADLKDIEVVAINNLLEPGYPAHMLKYDSAYDRFGGEVSADSNTFIVNGKKIRLAAVKDPSELKQGETGIDMAIGSAGIFLTKEDIQKHIDASARKVIMSAPLKDDIPMFVYGVNHEMCKDETVTPNALCTASCLAPTAEVLSDKWDIKHSLMTTVYAATATQKTVDGPSNKGQCGGRGILESIIPSSTGAAEVVGAVVPQLNKKLAGTSFRVLTLDVSIADLTTKLENAATYAEVCVEMKARSEGALRGVLGYTKDKVVVTDFRGDAHISTFDAEADIALNGTFIKVVSWCDNEQGYSSKCLEMARVVNKQFNQYTIEGERAFERVFSSTYDPGKMSLQNIVGWVQIDVYYRLQRKHLRISKFGTWATGIHFEN